MRLGQPWSMNKRSFANHVSHMRFYAGYAGKVTGETVESNENKFTYTRREPYGVVGQIIPWNGPMVCVPGFRVYVMHANPAVSLGW